MPEPRNKKLYNSIKSRIKSPKRVVKNTKKARRQC